MKNILYSILIVFAGVSICPAQENIPEELKTVALQAQKLWD